MSSANDELNGRLSGTNTAIDSALIGDSEAAPILLLNVDISRCIPASRWTDKSEKWKTSIRRNTYVCGVIQRNFPSEKTMRVMHCGLLARITLQYTMTFWTRRFPEYIERKILARAWASLERRIDSDNLHTKLLCTKVLNVLPVRFIWLIYIPNNSSAYYNTRNYCGISWDAPSSPLVIWKSMLTCAQIE